jgi:hypothetical protein
MIEAYIWVAFQEVGFEFGISREPYRLCFSEENRKEVHDFMRFGRSTSLLRNCRHTAKKPGLDGLINLIN